MPVGNGELLTPWKTASGGTIRAARTPIFGGATRGQLPRPIAAEITVHGDVRKRQ